VAHVPARSELLPAGSAGGGVDGFQEARMAVMRLLGQVQVRGGMVWELQRGVRSCCFQL
jgi:hypothetical protein